jgi:hypothetical protein
MKTVINPIYVGGTVNNCMLCEYIVFVNHYKYHIIHFNLPVEDCKLEVESSSK